jgi:hypothetical protein
MGNCNFKTEKDDSGLGNFLKDALGRMISYNSIEKDDLIGL